MRHYLECVVKECHERYHLHLLFPDNPFILQITCGENIFGISVSKNKCEVIDEIDPLQSQLVIQGEEEILTRLFSGQERLSQMVDDGLLEVTGGYRPLLFGESLLWLTRSEKEELIEV
ncbi:hypothetical protein [Rossellomorea aquimaris]|uniref:hypothetical protein n=1 Tax=Rossellomorea aquimaris TaxID=189382 RepID=UPI0007D0A393|nr:hypothetical protein [Rossellomorea aquimaris]